MQFRSFSILLIFVLLLLTACEGPTLNTEMPDDGPAITVSRESAVSFITKSLAAGDQSVLGPTTWQVTEEEATSFVALGSEISELIQLQTQFAELTPAQQQRVDEILANLEIDQAQADEILQQIEQHKQAAGVTDLPIPDLTLRLTVRDPQIYFKDDGRIIMRGFAELRGRGQPVRMVFAPQITGNTLQLDFVEGKIGAIPLPEALIDTVGSGLAKSIMAGRSYAELTDLRVEEGVLTISGQRN